MEKYVHRRSDRHLPPVSLIVFAALLCGFALVNLFWPKRENSELENRKLAQMPVFSVKTLLNGKWQDDFSTYLQDQVALRDGWINLESAVNALAFGKTEESGILNGKDGTIPPVFLYYDIFRNIATANFYFSFTAFSAVFGVPVSPLPSLPKVQGFRQILQAVYCLRSSDWMLFSHCVIQPSYCRPVFPAPLSLF